jgi:hypothetical protein
MNRYISHVVAAAETDTYVPEQFLRVINLIDPPTRLLHPSMISRIALSKPRTRNGNHRQPNQS